MDHGPSVVSVTVQVYEVVARATALCVLNLWFRRNHFPGPRSRPETKRGYHSLRSNNGVQSWQSSSTQFTASLSEALCPECANSLPADAPRTGLRSLIPADPAIGKSNVNV
jgi:hypothetical protein